MLKWSAAVIIVVCACVCVGGKGPWKGMEIYCKPEAIDIQVQEDDCMGQGTVNYCRGYCPSATTHTNHYPYYKPYCTCCQASVMTALNITMQCQMTGLVRQAVKDSAVKCKCQKCIPK